MTQAGIFDLDNTIVRGSLLFHFAIEMARQGHVRAREVLRYAKAEATYVRARHEIEGIGPRVAARALHLVADLDVTTVEVLAREFVFTKLERHVTADVRAEIRAFQRAGVLTVLATASPQELADPVAAWLGMDCALGTRSEVIDGRYSGRLVGEVNHGAVKARNVAGALSRMQVDPTTSWAYSDSINDLPLLTLVGNPVAVFPDRRLRAHAGAAGWRILDGRSSQEPVGFRRARRLIAT